MLSVDKICRICFDEGTDLISPCLCCSYVHRTCLDKWRIIQPHAHTQCEVCQYVYEYETITRSTRYFICDIIVNFIIAIIFIHCLGYFIGACLTGFGNFKNVYIYKDYVDLSVFQYLYGNFILHIFFGIVYYFKHYFINNDCTEVGWYPIPLVRRYLPALLSMIVMFFVFTSYMIIGIYIEVLKFTLEHQVLDQNEIRIKNRTTVSEEGEACLTRRELSSIQLPNMNTLGPSERSVVVELREEVPE